MTRQIHQTVKDAYAKIAQTKGSGGCNSCEADAENLAYASGYTDKEMEQAPSEANWGLSCGNPTAIASLRQGETVLDLGSGAGFDCFLAAAQVGEAGKVIGVDMTPEMIYKARHIAQLRKVGNVEFLLGEIENLPVPDQTIDVVISNCVINLVPDKLRVFQEAYRVLKRGGRLAVSDTALQKALPKEIKQSADAYVACIAGAIPIASYKPILAKAGFHDIRITVKTASSCISPDTADPIGQAIVKKYGDGVSWNNYVASIYIEAVKNE